MSFNMLGNFKISMTFNMLGSFTFYTCMLSQIITPPHPTPLQFINTAIPCSCIYYLSIDYLFLFHTFIPVYIVYQDLRTAY